MEPKNHEKKDVWSVLVAKALDVLWEVLQPQWDVVPILATVYLKQRNLYKPSEEIMKRLGIVHH